MPSIALTLAGAYFVVFVLALLWNVVIDLAAGISAAMRVRQFPPDAPSFEPRIVVTLVHGTWARRTTWILPDSPLCQTLVRAADASVLFQRFLWSGRNSISARRAAVNDLVAHLHAVIEQWPTAEHYVVAHSHGGNVAFQALADAMLNKRIQGLVCLSTPFLTIMRRELGPVGRTVLWWLPVLLIFYAGVFVLHQLALSDNDALGAVWLVIAVAAGFLTSRLLTRLEASVAESLKYPAVDPSKVLILRAAGDEASAALGATHLLSWLSGRLWLIASRLLGQTVDTVEGWRQMLIGRRLATALVVTCLALVSVIGVIRWSSIEGTMLQPIVPLAGGSLLLLVATLFKGGLAAEFLGRLVFAAIAAPFLMFIAMLGVALGPELLAAGLLFQVTAEATPPGRWVVWQVATNLHDADERAATGLMHSATYQDVQALQIVEAWFAAAVRADDLQAGVRDNR
jgi:pimeloyl-ACP methyl ester carboxylesterase